MDPLDARFSDIHELILQHLNAKDAIKCFQVSRSWNEIIGTTPNCMKNIWLSVEETSAHYVKRSSRKYQNFRIQPGSKRELSMILKKYRAKKAIISDDHDEKLSFQDYYDFMSVMAPTIEDLQPGEAIVKNPTLNREIVPIDFPKLKELQCTVTNRNAFSIFLGSNPQLKRVLLSFDGLVVKDLLVPDNIIHQFLQRNPQIESLFVCEVDSPFLLDVTENVNNQNLKCFSFAKTNPPFAWNVKDNMVKFIAHQQNLIWLKIYGLHDWDVLLRIWTESHFSKLFIMDCSLKGAMHGRSLPENLLIDEINFYLNPSCHIVKFLKATPNLKSFKVRQLSKQLMEFCARNLPKLESIKYQSIETCVENCYNDLKATTGDDVNRQIRLEEMDFFEFVGRDAGF